QTFYPWGKGNIGILLDNNLLNKLANLSQQCQTYYIGIEKGRNGSLEKTQLSLEIKDQILNELEEVTDQVKSQEPGYAFILENSIQKQSLMAALVAHMLDLDYRILQTSVNNGKCEVHGVIRDRSGYKIEAAGISDPFDFNDLIQSLGSFDLASKKAYISAVGQISELDLAVKITEVLI
ncbi:MAG: hypothetical protein ACHQYP_09195, partial [Nitrospiria bacterium]